MTERSPAAHVYSLVLAAFDENRHRNSYVSSAFYYFPVNGVVCSLNVNRPAGRPRMKVLDGKVLDNRHGTGGRSFCCFASLFAPAPCSARVGTAFGKIRKIAGRVYRPTDRVTVTPGFVTGLLRPRTRKRKVFRSRCS